MLASAIASAGMLHVQTWYMVKLAAVSAMARMGMTLVHVSSPEGIPNLRSVPGLNPSSLSAHELVAG